MEKVNFTMTVDTFRAILNETTLEGKLSLILLLQSKKDKVRLKSGVMALDNTIGNFLIWYPEGLESTNIGKQNVLICLDNLTYLDYLKNILKKVKGNLNVGVVGETEDNVLKGLALQINTETGQKFSLPLTKNIDESNEYSVSIDAKGNRKEKKEILVPSLQARTTSDAVTKSLSIYDAMSKEDRDYKLSFTPEQVLFLLGQPDNPTLPFAELPLEAEMVKAPKSTEDIPIVSVLQDVVKTIGDKETIDLSVFDTDSRRFVEVKTMQTFENGDISKIRIIDLSTRTLAEDTLGVDDDEEEYEENGDVDTESAIGDENEGETSTDDLL